MDSTLKGYAPDGGAGTRVYEVDIVGTIDLGLAAFVERITEQASAKDVVLIRMKTFGGRVDAAVRIRDALLGAPATTVVYVDRRAISAGALISLAAHTIVMSEGASIGAATPVQGGAGGEMKPTTEKVVSYMRAEMRATAEARGRRGDIAEAMVDAEIEVEGVSEKGKLLTLTSTRALELKVADAVLSGYEDVFEVLNLVQAERVLAATHWGEKVARFLTDPAISSLLMTFGMLGLLLELYTPGFGVGGAIGVTCLALFFIGQHAAHLAGWEEALILGVGAVLLMVEVFVIPGFGVAGVLGIACLVTAAVMALVELNLPLDVALDLGLIHEALESAAVRLAIMLVVGIAAGLLLARRFPSMKAAQAVILNPPERGSGVVSTSLDYSDRTGERGVTVTSLRPSGFVELDGERINALTEGDFIDPGTEVEVIRAQGNEVVVRKV